MRRRPRYPCADPCQVSNTLKAQISPSVNEDYHPLGIPDIAGKEPWWIPVGPRLLSHEGEVPHILLDVGGEGRLDGEHGAVVKTDLTDGEILHRIGLVVPVRPLGHHV